MKKARCISSLQTKRTSSNVHVRNVLLEEKKVMRINEGIRRFYCAEDREAARMTKVFFSKK